eukprot:250502-Chlamydomonas_euryale.AAC.7
MASYCNSWASTACIDSSASTARLMPQEAYHHIPSVHGMHPLIKVSHPPGTHPSRSSEEAISHGSSYSTCMNHRLRC